MKRKILENTLVAAALVIFTFLICMLSPTNLWENLPIGTDSGVFRYVALAMSKGEVMYRDCFDHKGPLLYFINYLGMFLSYYKGIWFMEVLFMLGTVSGIYKIARMFCGKLFSCVATFTVLSSVFQYFDEGNFTEEYAMPLILWSLYIFLDYFLNEKVSGLRILLCGSMFAGVVMLRANMVAVWMVFCVAVLIQKVYQKIHKDSGALSELLKFLGWFLCGFLVITVPIVVYLCIKGDFSFFIQDYFGFNFMYSASAFAKVPKLISYIYFVDSYWMLASLGIMLYVLVAEKDKKKKYVYGVYFLFIVCSISLVCMSGNYYPHYGMTLVPVFTLPVALLLGYAEKSGKEHKQWYFIIYCCMIFMLPPWMQDLKNIAYAHYYGETSKYGNDLALTINTVLENSTQDDKITVWGNDAGIYVYTNRLSASRYSYQFPIALVKPEIYDEYFKDLEQNLPKLVVVSNSDSERMDAFRMQDFLQIHNYELIMDTVEFQVYSCGQ